MEMNMDEDRETTSDSDVEVDEDGPPEFAGQANLSSFVNMLFSFLVEGTQVYSTLPTQEEFKYHESFRAFPKEMAQYASILLHLIEDTSKTTMKKPIDLSKGDSDAKLEAVVEAVDALLEQVDNTLDEMKGKKDKSSAAARKYASLRRISGVLRPQLKFNPPPDNTPVPFRVKIYKDGILTFGEPGVHYFEDQITAFKPCPAQLELRQEQMYASLDNTRCTWVDTIGKLQELERTLANCTEFAVDIEAHSYRSFQGFVCLLQFSTRQEDFLVDALELRDHLHCLQSVFTDPKITKVMHGAHYDVEWLQRDFGVYIVNLFDTSCAAKVLEYQSLGLAHLLKYFCDVHADKRFQTADWRIRPLPSEMLQYAREDTHYLLYVHDRLKVLLTQTPGNSMGLSGLEECYELSKEICLRKYEKPLMNDLAFQNFVDKRAPGLSRPQEDVLRVLMQWRDSVARAEDESTGYVLPSAMMLQLAREMPTTTAKLSECCNPVPALVRRDGRHLLDLIAKALQSASTSAPAEPRTPPPVKAADGVLVDSSPSPSPVPCDGFAPPAAPSSAAQPRGAALTSQSPVLGTEQLYQVAGWVEQPGTDTSLPCSVPIPAAKPPTQLSPLAGISLTSQLSSEADKDAYVPKSNVSAASEGGSALYSSLASERGPSPSSKIDFSKLFANVPSGATPAARVSSSFFSNSPSPPPSAQPSRLFAESPAPAPAPEGHGVQATPPAAEGKSKGEGKDNTPPEDRVPRSLTEIYSLSKQNKKRNKDKKKLKEDSITDPSPAFAPAPAAEENEEEVDMEEGPARNIKDPIDFMSDIGWVTDRDAVRQLMDAASQEGGGNSSGGSGKPDPPAVAVPAAGPTGAPTPASTHVPQPQRPTTTAAGPPPARQPPPPQPKFQKKPFHHTSNSGFVPYDYSQAQAPFGHRK